MNWILIGVVLLLAALLMCYAMTRAATRAEELGELFVHRNREENQKKS